MHDNLYSNKVSFIGMQPHLKPSILLPSWLLVFVQFTIIFWFLIMYGLWASQPLWLAVEWLGIALGTWSLLVMHPLKVSVFPEPRPNRDLVVAGPYTVIRHPMYTAVIMTCGALAADANDLVSWSLLVILIINQVFKLIKEEHLLNLQYVEYATYKSRTNALIPLIY
jgi:protein-S-isoprenylcysteine O-methyltransferase Ste14